MSELYQPEQPYWDAFWHFAAERQRMFDKRRLRLPPPWTDDQILANHRFTNCYRAADRVSQFLIRMVQNEGSQEPREVFFRTVLFRIFNKPETWLEMTLRLQDVPSLHTFSVVSYGRMLDEMAANTQIWSNAYMMCGVPVYGYRIKHWNWLMVLNDLLVNGAAARIEHASTLAHVYAAFTAPKRKLIEKFLAYQWTVDLNYASFLPFDEDDFVEPGPGAVRGIDKLFKRYRGTTAGIVRWMTERQEYEFERLGIDFPYLENSRLLHLPDIQNLLCEFDKYSRVAFPELDQGGKKQIKQKFDPKSAQAHTPIKYVWPAKWRLNLG